MEVMELVSSIAKGSIKAFVLPSDPSDPIRVSVTSGLSSAGWALSHCSSLAELGSITGSESLDFDQSRRVLMVPWPEDPIAYKQAILSVKQMAPECIVGFLSETFPPPRNKTTSSLLSVSVVPEAMKEETGQQLLADKLSERGLRATPSASRMMLNRVGGNLEALHNMVKSLSLFCGDEREVTDAVVLEAVPYIPEDDGKKTLEDLLHLRALSLARRMQWIPAAQIVPLFRAAASEMVIVHQVALLLDASDKGWVDPGKAAEAVGVRDDAMRSRYMPLAKELGKDRSSMFIARLEQADTVLLRTPFDSRDAATALAMQMCKI